MRGGRHCLLLRLRFFLPNHAWPPGWYCGGGERRVGDPLWVPAVRGRGHLSIPRSTTVHLCWMMDMPGQTQSCWCRRWPEADQWRGREGRWQGGGGHERA
jgi:hypothetical protein